MVGTLGSGLEECYGRDQVDGRGAFKFGKSHGWGGVVLLRGVSGCGF